MASNSGNIDDPDLKLKSKTTQQPASQPAQPLPQESRAEENANSQRNEQTAADGMVSDRGDSMVPDDGDAHWLGLGRPLNYRPNAVMSVKRDAAEYNMDHKRRGYAIILVHDTFEGDLQPRKSARHDTEIIKNALRHLNFDIEEYWNLGKSMFLRVLKEVSRRDHQDRDCLVIVFMSHGGVEVNNKEYLCTRDGKVDTVELWENFTADKCPSLAGKPKLFFIQACRGVSSDKGVQMKRPRGLTVQTDSFGSRDDYAIPLHGDMLIMWASYPRMYAFKSQNNGINGSVFIHFLAKVLLEDGQRDDLPTLLLRVTREVATLYESYHPLDNTLHQNKQIPYIASTLMRKVYFSLKT